jgi:hypothetical protein
VLAWLDWEVSTAGIDGVVAGLAASVVRERRNAAANRGFGQKVMVLYAVHCTAKMWAYKRT